MGIKTIKVLRAISKIVLLIIVLGLLGWGGYYVYRSIAFKPQNIIVTNITDSSATITWITSSQMNGVVYYKKDTSVLPGPLGILGSHVAYDDRDVSDAQTACVNEFNKNAGETKDEDFSVSGENFDCENARVTGMGKYYTHSVTIKDLDPESTYYFSMGDGIWSFKSDISSVKTFALLEEVQEPMPIFGRVLGDDDTYSRDALVYITFNDGSEGIGSVKYSSTTNDSGGWYLDASGVRDVDGNVMQLEPLNDTLVEQGVYSNYGISKEITLILTSGSQAFPDILVERQAYSFLSKLVSKVFAGNETCGYVSGYTGIVCGSGSTWHAPTSANTATLVAQASVIGYGNVTETLSSMGQLNASTMTQMGLGSAYDYYYLTNTSPDTEEDVINLQTAINNGSATITVSNNTTSGSVGYTNSNGEAVSCVTNGSCTVDDDDDPPVVVGNNEGVTIKDCQMAPESDECSIYCFRHPNVAICREVESTEDPNACTELGACEQTTQGYSVCSGYQWIPANECPDVITNYIPAEEECDLEVEFNNRADLSNCRLTCSGTTINVAASRCRNLLPETPEVNEPTSANYSFVRYGSIVVSEISLETLADIPTRFNNLVEASPGLSSVVWDAMDEMTENAENSLSNTNQFRAYCNAVGGSFENVYPYQCTPSGSSLFERIELIPGVYAQGESTSSYALYLPESGLYSFELGDYVLGSKVSDSSTGHLFYIEANGIDGFQMPVDPENPTDTEDLVLDSNTYEISYTQESTAQKYNVEEGINILSFNFVPVSGGANAFTAEDLIIQAADRGVNIKYVAIFNGGRWSSGYSCASDICTGTNFSIVPGRGYLIYANNAGTITIPGYNLKSSIPVAFSSGWNLVGIHGYTTAYTARTLIDSINAIDGLTANNVSWWPTSKGKYEGLQVENSTEYGLDFAISPTNGYFVRISEFAPSDTTCKSILWNDGGTLNGTCGNTK